ncbi:hypothetical protein [Thermosipho sp. 1063]|uniref:hypothetical protein n=1 Tax=Thermosipho sp. 1063 TaxID=1462747 RepID=UPI001E5955CC|nr:hypothetical protein [Thermosipho sp. 1063]
MDLLYFKSKKILHTTHKMADCDGIASIYWGLKVFGGTYYIPPYELRSAYGLLKYLNLSFTHPNDFDYIFVYDTDKREDLNINLSKPYVIFDHHNKRDHEFFQNALFSYSITSSANVINLYNLSIELGIELDETTLFFLCNCTLYGHRNVQNCKKKRIFVLFKVFGKQKI